MEIPQFIAPASEGIVHDLSRLRGGPPVRNTKIDKGDPNKYARRVNFKPLEKNRFKFAEHKFNKQKALYDTASKELGFSEILRPEDDGFVSMDVGDDVPGGVSQTDILKMMDEGTKSKLLEMELSYGPYSVDFSRNGRCMIMGGKKGSCALLDLHTLKTSCEINVEETVRDVTFLQSHLMWAAARKKYVYIYDTNGVEIHCLRTHKYPNALEYLPFHFLLASVGETGILRYQDISTGDPVSSHVSGKGPCRVMTQNPKDAVIYMGHASGHVTGWVPNLKDPAVVMKRHFGPLSAVASYGDALITAGHDGYWKAWDIRKFGEEPVFKQRYFGPPPQSITFAQNNQIGIGFGSHVQIWDKKQVMGSFASCDTKPSPILSHEIPGAKISKLAFRPYEDLCYIGHSKGISSMICPGSCIANIESSIENPYETKTQRKNREVRMLLEKIPYDMISLKQKIGQVQTAKKEKDDDKVAISKLPVSDRKQAVRMANMNKTTKSQPRLKDFLVSHVQSDAKDEP
eukprot:GHVO01022312.1.p1 GENE.GHVO01022312.1~~GHVO01022312.1.p1  ORF type:complete len:525 (+),score=78.28 GHVO01022312.1:31-1575(+)